MERVVSEAVSTRTAMGFGRGEGRRRGLWQVYTWAFEIRRKTFFLSVLKATLGSGKGGFGSRVDSHCYGVWEWRRAAPGVLDGMGFGSGGEWRRGLWQVHAWAFEVRRKAFFFIRSKSNVRQWKGWFRQPCRLALLWGLGVAKGGAGGFGKCIRRLHLSALA